MEEYALVHLACQMVIGKAGEYIIWGKCAPKSLKMDVDRHFQTKRA